MSAAWGKQKAMKGGIACFMRKLFRGKNGETCHFLQIMDRHLKKEVLQYFSV